MAVKNPDFLWVHWSRTTRKFHASPSKSHLGEEYIRRKLAREDTITTCWLFGITGLLAGVVIGAAIVFFF